MKRNLQKITVLLLGLSPLTNNLFAKEDGHQRNSFESFLAFIFSPVHTALLPFYSSSATSSATSANTKEDQIKKQILQESKQYLASDEVTPTLQEFISHVRSEGFGLEKTDKEIIEDTFVFLSQE